MIGNLVEFTGILALVGFLQLVVFGLQSYYLRKTVKAAAEQAEDMKRAINEAGRSATAMEQVAVHIEVSARAATDSVIALKERTAQQMRAYLTVLIGAATYQNRGDNLRFESEPLLINTGHTPAHKVRYKAQAAILPVPLPDDFDFPLTSDFIGESMLGPQQNANLVAIVDKFSPEHEVHDIKLGKGKALYVWGIVEYEDIFKTSQNTKFCQSIFWGPTGKVFGYYISRHNEAT